MSDPGVDRAGRGFPLATVVAGMWLLVVAWFAVLGSDLLWAVALGDDIRAGDGVPHEVPFASAPQAVWHNPVAVAELLLSVVHAAGGPGLVLLQVVLVGATLAVVVAEGQRLGGGEGRVALAVSLLVIGTSAALVIVRLPSLSLLPFVLALAVMRRQHARPTRAVWWLVPLYVLWGNLHGAVLVGLAVLAVFLVLSPGGGPVLRRVGVGVGCLLALVLTSAGLQTPAYYVQALGNEAAARNTDLWARPDPAHPLDLAMLLTGLVLLVLALRGRPPLWEWVVTLGLLGGLVEAGRNGVWLLLFLAPAAARVAARADSDVVDRRRAGIQWVAVGIVVVGGVGLVLGRGAATGPPGTEVVAAVRSASGGAPVLADEPLAETLGQAGVTVWAANPIDAFPHEVQGRFLDFLHDGTVPDDPTIGVVVVAEALAPVVERQGWTRSTTAGPYVILRRG